MIYDEKKYKFRTYLSDNLYRDQNNFLVCTNCTFGRTGIQKYGAKELGLNDKSGIIEVYRDEKDVFDEESLASLDGRPLTLGHVYEKEGVTISNFNKYAKGQCFNIRREDNNIVGDIRVFDEQVASLIEKRKLRELSLGYKQRLYYDKENERYSFKDIIYNHLALVAKGRAGNAMIFDSDMEENMEDVLEEVVVNDEAKETVETIETVETTEVVDVVESNEEVTKTEEVIKTEEVEVKEESIDVVEVVDVVDVVETKVEVNDEIKEEIKEEIKKEGEPTMDNVIIKDTAYFLEKQKEIARIEDEGIRGMMSQALAKEMKEHLKDEDTTPTIQIQLVNDSEDEDDYDDYDDKMQAFFDSFDPHSYGSREEYEKAIRENCISEPIERIYRREKIKKNK